VQAQKAVGEDTTAQEGTQLLLDEAGHRTPAVARLREEALELLSDRPVKEGLLGPAGDVRRVSIGNGSGALGGSD
jgi:hypothetical protein